MVMYMVKEKPGERLLTCDRQIPQIKAEQARMRAILLSAYARTNKLRERRSALRKRHDSEEASESRPLFVKKSHRAMMRNKKNKCIKNATSSNNDMNMSPPSLAGQKEYLFTTF